MKFNYESGVMFYIANDEDDAEKIRESNGCIGDDFYSFDIDEAKLIVEELQDAIKEIENGSK